MQLAAFYAAGFEIEAYAWVSFKDTWQTEIDHCLLTISPRSSIRRLWLDCEEDAPGLSTAQIVGRIKSAIAYIASKRPDLQIGIYTARWWWMKIGNPTDFCGYPLWTAGYTSDGNPPSTDPLLYGGWQSAVMWQYAGSVETCGLNIDRSIILEEHMPTPEYTELSGALAETNTIIVTVNTKVDALANLMKIVIPKLADENDADVKALLAQLGGK
jgi:hypothetical protein